VATAPSTEHRKGHERPRRRPRRDAGPDPLELIGQNRALPYLYSAPALLTIAVVLAFPVGYAIYQSTLDSPFVGLDATFVGFDNYVQLVQDRSFWAALGRSLVFVTGCVVIGQVIAVSFAFVLNAFATRMRFVRGLVILPYIVSSVALAVMFRVTFNQDLGIPNRLLGLFGVEGPAWLADPTLAMVVVIVAQVWSDAPLSVLLVLGGLQTIDKALMDAAVVDGATGWKRARLVSLPLIAPQLVLSTLWLSYTSFTTLGVILALTGGGPGTATRTLTMEMYSTAFRGLDFYGAMAIAVILLLCNVVLSAFYLRLARRYDVG
jgi:multiple sugar transport system permease protein